MLPGKVGDRGRSGADNRLFVEAVVLWIAHRQPVARFAGAVRSLAGTARTSDLPAGHAQECGIGCSRHWAERGASARSSSIRPSIAPTSMPLALPKKRPASARSIARGTDHEDPCGGRRHRSAHPGAAERRPDARRDPGASLARSRTAKCVVADKAYDATARGKRFAMQAPRQ